MTLPVLDSHIGADDSPITIDTDEPQYPFVLAHHWVLLAPISPAARQLYLLMAMHLNPNRASAEVWPSKNALAKMMGLSKPASLDRYLTELYDAQMVRATSTTLSGGMRARNHYTLRTRPPKGWRSPTSVGEWYTQNRVSAGGNVVPKTGLRETGAKGKPAGGNVVPKTGVRSPQKGTSVVPKRGLKQEEVELNKRTSSSSLTSVPTVPAETSEPSSSEEEEISGIKNHQEPTQDATRPAVDAEVDESSSEEDFPAELKRWVADLEYYGRTPTVTQYRQIAAAALKLFTSGVHLPTLRRELLEGSGRGVANVVGLYISRLKRLQPSDIQQPAATKPRSQPQWRRDLAVEPAPRPANKPWCGNCDQDTRTQTYDSGIAGTRKRLCPDCGPHIERLLASA